MQSPSRTVLHEPFEPQMMSLLKRKTAFHRRTDGMELCSEPQLETRTLRALGLENLRAGIGSVHYSDAYSFLMNLDRKI